MKEEKRKYKNLCWLFNVTLGECSMSYRSYMLKPYSPFGMFPSHTVGRSPFLFYPLSLYQYFRPATYQGEYPR
jgi:hypothetical protein